MSMALDDPWMVEFLAKRANDNRPLDMAGHPPPPALPNACDHVALFYRKCQMETPCGHFAYGVFSRQAFAYEEASHLGCLLDRPIPARWPDEPWSDPAPSFPYALQAVDDAGRDARVTPHLLAAE